MRLSLLLLAGVGAVSVMLMSVPARADRDDWRRHEWRERQRYVYAPPPVYYYLPPEYYAPPPVYGPGNSLFGAQPGNSLFGPQ